MRKGILTALLLLPASLGLAQDSVLELIDHADEMLRTEGASMAAADAYRAVCLRYPGTEHAARARYLAAECLYQLGDLSAAQLEFSRVAKAGGSQVLVACAELRLGQCDFDVEEFEKAEKHFHRVIDNYGDTYLARDARFALAQTLVALGEWERFHQVADELVSKWPGYGERLELRFAYGVYHYQKGELDEAMGFFHEVESERSRYYYARCLADEGQYLKAIQQYRQLLVRYPQTPLAEDVRFAIAESFLRSGQRSLARQAFQEVLQKHPDGPNALAARFKLSSIMFREKDYSRVLESLEILLADAGGDPLREKILMLQGLAFFELGRESEADHAFSAILQLFPEGRTGSTALFKMLHHYSRNASWNQSIGLGHMFLDRFSGDPLAGRVQLIQALAYLELGEMKKARDVLGKLLDMHSETDLGEKSLFLMTWSYHQEQDLSRIVTNYRHMARRLLPTPNPWRARTYYLIAESYYELGLHQDAADLYRLVLNDYPFSDVAPYSLQGMMASYSQLGDDQKAALEQERYLLVISNEASDNPGNALAAAGMYFNRKEYKRALELYENFLISLPDAPDRPEALYQSGECMYALHYYEDAVGRWQQLLLDHPDYGRRADVLLKLGDTLFGLQRYTEAKGRYEELVQRFPEHPSAEEALFNQANCLYNLQDYENAVAGFENYCLAHPRGLRLNDAQQAIQACYFRGGKDLLEYVNDNPEAVFAAEVLWEKGGETFRNQRYEEAAAHFERITLNYPDNEIAPEALYYLAESRYAMGEQEAALAAFENYTATYPDRELVPTALLKAGTILYAQESYAEAAGHFLILSDQYAGSELAPLGLYNAGLCYRKLEQWQAFLRSGEEFLDRFADHERRVEIQMQMAEVFQSETGEYEQALRIHDQLLDVPEAPVSQVLFLKGECLSKLGRDEEAAAAYLQAAESGGGLGDFGTAALARLAASYEDNGKLDEARELYSRIAESSDNEEWAGLARERMESLDLELEQANAK